MELIFRTGRKTKVRFFAKMDALDSALAKEQGLLLQDPGVPRKGFTAFLLAQGEECKNWAELVRVLDWLSEKKAEKSQTLIAVGGGATLDLSALAASLYRRGMPLLLVPTTLLGMVDATLGGKTAVDRLEKGTLQKNFAGTFYPADEVWVCLDFLSTLPLRERISGAGECWKTLWLSGKAADAALISFVRTGKTSPALLELVKKCLQIKKRFVEKDPLDTKRIRESLNYGHTVGHALESLAGGRISHGEAVLWGMLAESFLLGKKGAVMQEIVRTAIQDLGLSLPKEFSLPESKWLPLLQADKKSKGGVLVMTVLSAPGKLVKTKLTATALAASVTAFPELFRPA